MSKPFPEITTFDYPRLEQELLTWWDAHQTFQKSLDQHRGAPHFTFYEGPPTANGRPGLHHIMARTIKDIFCRYKTMKGFLVERKAGWDTHGLPVEIEVEKELGLEGRHQVEAFGMDRYNAACRESVLRYKDLFDQLTVRMGYWVDLSDPYITFENKYIESVWWLIKRIYEKGLLYKGYKIQWYSPGSGTVLSSHEVSLGYQEVQDPSVYVRFPIRGEEKTAFLAWTTTPWTLISNTALAVGPSIEYVKVRIEVDPERGQEELILARDRLSVLRESYEVLESFTGSHLVGKRYEPVFDAFLNDETRRSAWRVVSADFVSTEDGTGIVHLAPAFGADDFAVGRREDLPLFNPVSPAGRFTEAVPLVEGLWFKDADKVVVRNLRDRGLLYRQESYLHNYPHDWRKGTPLISYPVESWFIRTTAIKDRMVELNNTINWQPEAIGAGRFGQWLENNVDWALSRNRFWGTPLPIWISDAPGSQHIEVIGSIAELRARCGAGFPSDEDLDLHRPHVDGFTWPAPDGGTMRRVTDLIDVWFDSGAMPFAQWHYPFENVDRWQANFPADFIAEGVDQTRGWFYTLHAIACLVEDRPAFKSVVVNGMLLDENGDKMSKSRGNAVEPFATIAEHGADPVRWYMMSNSPPWENLRWSDRGLRDTKRKFFSTLGNTYNFFATYANIDGFDGEQPRIPVAQRAELDRWIISRLNTVIGIVDSALADYNPTRAARAIEALVEELSNWYVRRSRRRFWRAEHGLDKTAAYQTVHECLLGIAKLMAPIAPFYSEALYRALAGGTAPDEAESVHLARFPELRADETDAELERRMDLARTMASVVLALRNQVGINVRQPLGKLMVVVGGPVDRQTVDQIQAIVLDEVNVKAMEYVGSSSGLVHKSARPNFKTLGRRLGPLMKPVAAVVRELSSEELVAFEQTGTISITLEDGVLLTLSGDDIEIQSEGIEGWLVGQEAGVTVALDVHITDELLAEGLAREFVNRVQKMRKDSGFDVVDRVRIEFAASDVVRNAIGRHEAWIRNETLANELQPSESPQGDFVATFDVDGEQVQIGVRREEKEG